MQTMIARWLESMAFAPLKLKRLATLNTILGARPWAFNQQHIKVRSLPLRLRQALNVIGISMEMLWPLNRHILKC